MDKHTVSAYDAELRFVLRRISEMGGQAERIVEQAVTSLIRSDTTLAQKVVADDLLLDAAQRDLDERAVMIIARRQPMARDLREVVGAIRISSDLERIGDLGKNIAKRVVAVQGHAAPVQLMRGLETMADRTLDQLKNTLDLYGARDSAAAAALRANDAEIDALYTSLFGDLLEHMAQDSGDIPACTHLMFSAKNIERIGDHATNIAETVYYIETGAQMETERPKNDRTTSVLLGERARG